MAHGTCGDREPGMLGTMLLRFLASLRVDISVGPAWIGRTCARWMLDTFCRDRDGYISPAIPRYPMLPEPGFPASSLTALREAERLARAAGAARGGRPYEELDAWLHAHPDVMRDWLARGLPPSVMPYPRGSFR